MTKRSIKYFKRKKLPCWHFGSVWGKKLFNANKAEYMSFMRPLSKDEISERNEVIRQNILALTGVELPPFKDVYIEPQNDESVTFTYEINNYTSWPNSFPDLAEGDQKARLYKL